jgi:predicted Kef-type K+ transport protein
MNLFFIGAISLCVALLVSCVALVWREIPIYALAGLVLSSFTYGFILGENTNDKG